MNTDRHFQLFLLLGLAFACPLAFSTGAVIAENPIQWRRHEIVAGGHCNTAVALDVNGDKDLDVIASYDGKVCLLIAPDWDQEIVLHRFDRPQACIHSTTIDVDDDGDMDWAGTLAHAHPFWLENPGRASIGDGMWKARSIDNEITGIHCILRSDIDNDGKQDLVINNFQPDKGIGDSMAWFSVPENPKSVDKWNRHIFANGDARGGSHYMGAGDIDNDGWKEIAVGAKGKPFADGNWFAYWKNPGKSGVKGPWSKVMLAENQTGATNISPADVNGDGQTDWIATRGHGLGVFWFESPDWLMHEIDPDLQFPHSVAIADFDQDGDIDAASCGYGSERVMWYENDGKGHFMLHAIDHNQQSYDLRSVDMDGDGDLDLLNAGRGTNNVVWYENN